MAKPRIRMKVPKSWIKMWAWIAVVFALGEGLEWECMFWCWRKRREMVPRGNIRIIEVEIITPWAMWTLVRRLGLP